MVRFDRNCKEAFSSFSGTIKTMQLKFSLEKKCGIKGTGFDFKMRAFGLHFFYSNLFCQKSFISTDFSVLCENHSENPLSDNCLRVLALPLKQVVFAQK